MRICYVANSRFPSERAHMTQMVQMCNAFSKLGHEVTLLVTDRKTDITESPETFFGTAIEFAVVRIPVPDIAGASPRILPIFRPYLFMIQRLVFAVRAARHARAQSYTHLYGRDEWILWLLLRFTRVPVVWESHEAKFSFIARSLLHSISHVVVISEGIRDFYVSRGVPEEKVLVAHDAVDDRFFSPQVSREDAQREVGITTKKPVVMYVGGLEPWKGAEILCEAAKEEEGFEMYIVGGKEKELPLFRKRYPHIRFLGPRPYRELPVVQQAADVLVIPNTAKVALSAEYTSPLKLFAYMTARKPIVASRIPSITSVLSEESAYFFIPDNPESLREAIHKALGDFEGSRVRRTELAYEESRKHTWRMRASAIVDFVTSRASREL